MTTAYEAIQEQIKRCSGSDVHLANGASFVRKLDKEQELRYLHKVYGPLDSSKLADVETELGFPAPAEYRDFLTRCSGASLFDMTFHIFGFDPIVSRSLNLEDQRPIHVEPERREFDSYRFRDVAGWRPVGALTLYNKIWILLNATGKVRIIDEKRSVEFSSFDKAVGAIVNRISSKLGCEPPTLDNGRELEDYVLSEIN